MKQIERYIFRRMSSLTFWSLLAVTLLVMTTQVLIRIDVLTTTGQALGAFLMLAATLIPSVLSMVAPFALLIGVGQVLSGMNTDSELVVVEAAGVAPSTIFKPVLVLSASISLMVLVVSNFIEPWSNQKLYGVLADAQSDLFSVAVRSGTFMQLEEGLYVQVNEKLPDGVLGGIVLVDNRAEDNETIYYARSGVIKESEESDTNILFLVDGELQQRTLTNNQISIVTFSSYALDMAAFIPASGSSTRRPKEQSTFYLLDPDAEDYYFKSAPHVIKEELVQRFSSWMYPLAFGLVAFSFLGKARSNRHEQFQNGGLVAAIAIGSRGFGFYANEAAGGSVVLEVLSYLVPVALIVGFGYLILTGRTLTIPKAWARMNEHLLEVIRARFTQMHTDRRTSGKGNAA
ncbi:LptF/LptG family permease [Hoeflea sp. YIM 152468]|uniref:LptF/LptG family permease n=1 Tax=Hoeflea sp. YIM 152468 TaxID=3031759 RepID=UPI0023D99451|nr:LptF/LptG family permease [Hoeflea sp. YIM 152468]MDF1607220.1 LptF/LptG family permease [Hoeflea sp. YIM 152468]